MQPQNQQPTDSYAQSVTPERGKGLGKKWIVLIVLATILNIGFIGLSAALGVNPIKTPASTISTDDTQIDQSPVASDDDAAALELMPFRSDYVRVSMNVPKEFTYVDQLDGDNAIIAFTGITISPDVVKDDSVSDMSFGRSIEISTGQIKEQIVRDNTDYGIFLGSVKKQVAAAVEETTGTYTSKLRFEREVEINGFKAYEAEVENRYLDKKDSSMDSVDRYVYLYVSNESDYSFKFTSYYDDAAFQRSTDDMVGSIRIE